MNKKNIIKKINKLSINGLWHQCIDFGENIKTPIVNMKKYYSSYYNKGKWNNFIKPLIPFKNVKNKIFLDMGCNAGLFLLCANKYGFKKIIGIEPNEIYFKQLEFVINYFLGREKKHKQIKILRRVIGNSTYSSQNNLLDKKNNRKIDKCKMFSFKEVGKIDIILLCHVFNWLSEFDRHEFIKYSPKYCKYMIVVDRAERRNRIENDKNKIRSHTRKKLRYFKVRGWKFKKKIFSGDLKLKEKNKKMLLSLLFESQKYKF